MLVVICDEVDQLASQDQEVLYELFALTKVGRRGGGWSCWCRLCCLGHDVLCWLVSPTWLLPYCPPRHAVHSLCPHQAVPELACSWC